MTEPIWVSVELTMAIHEEQLARFGGPTGLRDQGMLLSALDRPKNKWAYGTTDLAALAAAYAFGLARNHAFVDGNKRVAFLTMVTFLGLNHVEFMANEAETVIIIQDLAAGEIGEDELARWINDNWPAS